VVKLIPASIESLDGYIADEHAKFAWGKRDDEFVVALGYRSH
jgi:hypothetical protein